jgi:hypothetical protein
VHAEGGLPRGLFAAAPARPSLSLAARSASTPAQVVFRFAQAAGLLPLTGTTSAEHTRQDLASRDVPLSADEVRRSSRWPADATHTARSANAAGRARAAAASRAYRARSATSLTVKPMTRRIV